MLSPERCEAASAPPCAPLRRVPGGHVRQVPLSSPDALPDTVKQPRHQSRRHDRNQAGDHGGAPLRSVVRRLDVLAVALVTSSAFPSPGEVDAVLRLGRLHQAEPLVMGEREQE